MINLNLTTHELKLIARNRGIKNYRNMSREKLLSTLDESEHILKDHKWTQANCKNAKSFTK